MNVSKKGTLTEINVMACAIEHGFIVSIPYGDSDRYDQIWDDGNNLLRVQVKTSRWKNDAHKAIVFNCFSVSNGVKHKYTEGEIDLFATFWNGKCYVVPVSECSTEKTLWLYPPTQNCCKCSCAKEYELTGNMRK